MNDNPIDILQVDVLIVGAGVSGIGAACHLKRECPGKTFAIIERRQDIGGTWDLFRYPGIRSDSDMFTFGYNFKPWMNPQTLADGPSIKSYVKEAASENAVDQHIRYGTKMVSAEWQSSESQWTVTVEAEATGERQEYRCNFLLGCTGYYNYDKPYRPDFPGEENFKGTMVHPQLWPDDLDYKGKKVVVVGSGATAITLVPAMADDAAHVTMLQRSPTYIFSWPAIDPLSAFSQKYLPEKLAYRITRMRNVRFQRIIYYVSQKWPNFSKRFLLNRAQKDLGEQVNMQDFTPNYGPWDQRMCIVPDGDMFNVVREGKASVVTDHIDSFTENGIRLKSGKELEADIIITATGLDLQMLGGAELTVDGKPAPVNERLTYKGVLLEGIPNSAMIFGYINASWTLKADIASEYVCRLLNHMDEKKYSKVVPVDKQDHRTDHTVFGALTSGYVKRANKVMPRQGTAAPWFVTQNFMKDAPDLRYSPLEDEYLSFDDREPAGAPGLGANIGFKLRAVVGRV